MDIEKEFTAITKKRALNQLLQKYEILLNELYQGDVYIWGTGRLGHFAYEQCQRNHIEIRGYIDNDESKWSVADLVFSCERLISSDIVIIASLYYPDIIDKLQVLGIKKYIYYEELAFLIDGLETYSPTFRDILGELETNKEQYRKVYDLLEDDLSKEIYKNIISYRNTLDIKYTKRAFELSLTEGVQDFDKIVTGKLDKEYSFYDVGGFDGESTIQYIAHVGEYNEIYFFEPDKTIMNCAKERLKNYRDVIFIQAGVGERKGLQKYEAIGNGAGAFLEEGREKVEMVALDEFVDSHKSYIKMDIEGYELPALKGAERCIKQYKPMLSVSVYHLPGDIHRIIQLVLSWNSGYKVYMRHYSNSYVDTRVYFVDEE